jgi:hypothetical protein
MEDLQLHSNRFTGQLPASWASLKSLTTLDLSTNQLQGSIPTPWGALGATRLSPLNLFGNPRLVGCLPRGLERFQGAAVCNGTGLTCSIC